jgi:hypothetical protein
LGLIEKIEILRDQIEFLPSYLIEIRGQIARKLNFLGQLGVKLKKSETRDQFAKRAGL